jgi:hypothetical protein
LPVEGVLNPDNSIAAQDKGLWDEAIFVALCGRRVLT